MLLSLAIFSLVSFSDPFPMPTTVPAHVGNGKSHGAPFVQKTSPSLSPRYYGNLNKTSDNFSVGATQPTLVSGLTLQMNHNRKSLSALSQPIIISSILKQKKVPNIVPENTVENYTDNGSKISSSAGIPTSLLDPQISDNTTQIPLFLKLDKNYNPSQIAEYIFSTGDEKGFAQGVAEMIEDGQIMVSRDDVLIFLEAVQKQLAKLRSTRDYSIRVGQSKTENV